MARQFFVGGNFKLNPITREQKKSLIKVLNDANVDQNVGVYHLPYHHEHVLSIFLG